MKLILISSSVRRSSIWVFRNFVSWRFLAAAYQAAFMQEGERGPDQRECAESENDPAGIHGAKE
jgi:hypothetical protein